MSMSASVPATVHIKRTNLIGLVALAAIVAATVTALVLVFAVGTGSSVQASFPAVVVPSGQATSPMTSAEAKSVGMYLFGRTGSLTRAQEQQARNYWLGASMPIGPDEVKSIGSYLFGVSAPLKRTQLQTVRNYWLGASSPASTPAPDEPTPSAAKSIATYLLGHSSSLTPLQKKMISYYWFAAASASR